MVVEASLVTMVMRLVAVISIPIVRVLPVHMVATTAIIVVRTSPRAVRLVVTTTPVVVVRATRVVVAEAGRPIGFLNIVLRVPIDGFLGDDLTAFGMLNCNLPVVKRGSLVHSFNGRICLLSVFVK